MDKIDWHWLATIRAATNKEKKKTKKNQKYIWLERRSLETIAKA